ncbi:hypothetical protein VOLCADRAFT_94148 [Volvox carteri f. nagariensis]|uniref:Uncharacterized protein n=1 Tax=Volvox carteri f. nagariensis TaxID=3068 RepID=D8U499_VOLCA|nr:uncharacterized protein VOLCADRAFT_94148 [Volvox carteri f. nagariensis]EFJ45465.1 hypothetical protein VOLCADRAFT_94148 [Volvox carteri f. nagariensis]|eukprot:XP_002953492.1 hypothetical protein VOLCADRAFT_94148 [Volvox carteri f. nagariensis]
MWDHVRSCCRRYPVKKDTGGGRNCFSMNSATWLSWMRRTQAAGQAGAQTPHQDTQPRPAARRPLKIEHSQQGPQTQTPHQPQQPLPRRTLGAREPLPAGHLYRLQMINFACRENVWITSRGCVKAQGILAYQGPAYNADNEI